MFNDSDNLRLCSNCADYETTSPDGICWHCKEQDMIDNAEVTPIDWSAWDEEYSIKELTNNERMRICMALGLPSQIIGKSRAMNEFSYYGQQALVEQLANGTQNFPVIKRDGNLVTYGSFVVFNNTVVAEVKSMTLEFPPSPNINIQQVNEGEQTLFKWDALIPKIINIEFGKIVRHTG